MITPHIGGQADLSESRGKEMVENQLIRLSVGQPLENVIT
jgi:phosphoglycerate dehydrogenase-like enzyme